MLGQAEEPSSKSILRSSARLSNAGTMSLRITRIKPDKLQSQAAYHEIGYPLLVKHGNENHPLIDFPIKSFIWKGFPIAMFDGFWPILGRMGGTKYTEVFALAPYPHFTNYGTWSVFKCAVNWGLDGVDISIDIYSIPSLMGLIHQPFII